jgi:hypothetical protein
MGAEALPLVGAQCAPVMIVIAAQSVTRLH